MALNEQYKCFWLVFATEQLAFMLQDHNAPDAETVQKKILDAWNTLQAEEFDSLNFRANKLKNIVGNQSTHYGFWCYYYETYYQVSSSNPHTSRATSKTLFKHVFSAWKNLPSEERESLRTRAQASIKNNALPSMPDFPLSFKQFTDALNSANTTTKTACDSPDLDELSREALEELRDKGMSLLADLEAEIDAASNNDSARWLGHIGNVRNQHQKAAVLLGVIGATGAGKSAVINAVLDEEFLLPTSCWRACTAVVTEVSYNYETPDQYRAQIDFVDSSDAKDKYSNAGIALAKIRAVYPFMSADEISASNVEELLRHQDVATVLGTSKDFRASSAADLYLSLKSLIAGKEKSSGKASPDVTQLPELWPLISVIRVFTPTPLLKTGITIVDLPGVYDSNQARASIARNYLKKCSAFWIVAPIVRAVDDKCAKDLMGDAFKRQVALDGSIDDISFICSKADEIGVAEVQDALGLDLTTFYDKQAEYDARISALRKPIGALSADIRSMDQEHDEAAIRLERYEVLKARIEAGKTVYESDLAGLKRRNAGVPGSSRRRRNAPNDLPGDGTDFNPMQIPLTVETISTKIRDLDERRVKLADIANSKEQEKVELSEELDELERNSPDTEGDIWRYCVSLRNTASRGAIKQDFAAGIEELDQESNQAADPDNFDPSVQYRNYDALAQKFPVFCVSSRGYQRLNGRRRKDKTVDNFNHADQTEIPALQAQCEVLAETAYRKSTKDFMNGLTSLITSMKLWATDEILGKKLTEEELAHENRYLQKELNQLSEVLKDISKAAMTSISKRVQQNILKEFPVIVKKGKAQAPKIYTRWGEPVNHQERKLGGLPFQTYKAIVRRGGVFQNVHGLHDFNDELSKPMITAITIGWAKTFNEQVPEISRDSSFACGEKLQATHDTITDRILHLQCSPAALEMLFEQLLKYKDKINEAFDSLTTCIADHQKEASRSFVPTIQKRLHDYYMEAAAVSGPGAFKRMKQSVEGNIERVKGKIFQKATETIKSKLSRMLKEAESALVRVIEGICDNIGRDYSTVFSQQRDTLSAEDVAVRERLRAILEREAGGFQCDVDTITKTNDDDLGPNMKTEKTEDIAIPEADGGSHANQNDEQEALNEDEGAVANADSISVMATQH